MPMSPEIGDPAAESTVGVVLNGRHSFLLFESDFVKVLVHPSIQRRQRVRYEE